MTEDLSEISDRYVRAAGASMTVRISSTIRSGSPGDDKASLQRSSAEQVVNAVHHYRHLPGADAPKQNISILTFIYLLV
jgi:hypothetical protein